jgi:hypothetical protein
MAKVYADPNGPRTVALDEEARQSITPQFHAVNARRYAQGLGQLSYAQFVRVLALYALRNTPIEALSNPTPQFSFGGEK